jgi:hypothetical protein
MIKGQWIDGEAREGGGDPMEILNPATGDGHRRGATGDP